MKIKRTLTFLFCMYLSFWVGYFVRSIHYRQDLPYLQKAQAENWLDKESVVSELADIIGDLNQDVEEIIDQNREHPVIVFIEEEE